jgi:hypothetical protein
MRFYFWNQARDKKRFFMTRKAAAFDVPFLYLGHSID